MANTQTSELKIDTLYVHEAMDQSAEAYKNLLLLALKNRTDLCRLGSAIDKSMENYSAGKHMRLHESFRGIAYMSALARENDRSLLKILYMGPKEQKALLRRIVKDISVDQVRDFMMLDPIRMAVEFKVILYSEEPVSGQSSVPRYLMTFKKRAVNNEEELSYTLEARFIRGDSDFEDPYFLFREQTLVWEEFMGDLATCIEKIISLKSLQVNKKGLSPENQKNGSNDNNKKDDPDQNKTVTKGNETFEDVLSKLGNGLSDYPPTNDSTADKKPAVSNVSSQDSYFNNKKSDNINKESDDTKNAANSIDEKPKKKTYKIIKCKESVMYHISEKGKLMYMVTSNEHGNDVYITVVVNKMESLIYVDGETYEKYKSFIKKKMKLR